VTEVDVNTANELRNCAVVLSHICHRNFNLVDELWVASGN